MTDDLTLYQSGLSLRDVGLLLGIPFRKVYAELKPLGVVRSLKDSRKPMRFASVQKQSLTQRAKNPRAIQLANAVELVQKYGFSFGGAAAKVDLTRSDVAGAVYRAKRREERGMV
jgi:hypothetical protein